MLFLLSAVFIWGFSFALSKLALNTLSPFELVTARMFLGALTGWLITSVLRARRGGHDPQLEDHGWAGLEVLILGLFEFAGTYILYTWALHYLPSGVVGALTLLTPFLTYIVAVPMGVDRFHSRALVSVLLAIVGAALCLPVEKIFSGFAWGEAEVKGTALILVSNLSFAIGNVFISRFQLDKRWNPRITYRAQSLAGVIALVCVFISGQHTDLARVFTGANWCLPLYLGVIATGAGFFLWNEGVKRVSATPAAVVGNFKAPLSIAFGAILLHEPVSLRLFLGAFLLIGATFLLKK